MFLLLPLFLWSVILVQPVLVGLVGFRAGTIEVEKESLPLFPSFFYQETGEMRIAGLLDGRQPKAACYVHVL